MRINSISFVVFLIMTYGVTVPLMDRGQHDGHLIFVK